MEEQLYIDGKKYLSTADAAEFFGYTPDYVGQLARDGKVAAKQIGRNWFVDEESIQRHKQLFDTEPGVLLSGILEHITKKKNEPDTKKTIFDRSNFVVYHKDESPLFPVLHMRREEIEITEDIESAELDTRTTAEPASAPLPPHLRRNTNPLSSFFLRSVFGSLSFAIVFLMVFSLNGSYAMTMLSNAFSGLAESVKSSAFVYEASGGIYDPLAAAALEFHKSVDATIEGIFYGD